MRLTPTALAGAFVIEWERIEDERGFFVRSFCREEFLARGLEPSVAQCSVSVSRRRGTLRGLHFQAEPYGEDKLVRCSHGAVYDVIVDLRTGAAGFGRWWGVELSRQNGRMLYVPRGLAHGFLALTDDVEVAYQMSRPYAPRFARGLRWDDPDVGIAWPFAPRVISERDRGLPSLRDIAAAATCASVG